MYRISKQFHFSAGHILAGMPEGHPCGRPHGHNYLVEARIGAPELDARGFVIDFGDLATFRSWLDANFDHRWLGSGPVAALGKTWDPAVTFNPTAERLAAFMGEWLRGWLATQLKVFTADVGVSETPSTWAWPS
jgi:6-pyruvoyltetrahydropterin/6-carboxytetrahydropterin synthase